MDARELVELAAVAATHGPAIIAGCGRLSPTGMQQFWTASRCRQQRWNAVLQEYRESTAADTATARRAWRMIHSTLEEILTGEVLTRVWTAICIAHDEKQGLVESSPLALSVLQGQQEARNRVLRLLVQPPLHASERLHALETLRRRCERWTDVLLANLLPTVKLDELAFDHSRVADFAETYQEQRTAGVGQTAWEMTLGSLSVSFETPVAGSSPNPDLNAGIVTGILSCFPAGLLEPGDWKPAAWMTRMQVTTRDAQSMIDELIALDRGR